MIATSRLAKAFGGRTLFEDVTLKLNPGSRYGLVGANGSGKTTFMKVVAGDEPATDGLVTLPPSGRVGVLRQDHFLEDGARILDLAMRGDTFVWPLLEERTAIVDRGEGSPERLGDIEHALSTADGYTLEARATAILAGLGIPKERHLSPLSTLSGGFKLRVLLAQVLVGGPDALLLDEPTNHLDIVSIRWLEKFLSGYRGAACVISHDQRFLDNIATHILDVDYGTITPYTGNFSAFLEQKRRAREQKEEEIARAEKIIAEKRAFVERFGAKATKAKQAQSRLKQIERIEVEELAETSRRTPLFRFEPERPSGKDVLVLDGIQKAYGEKKVLTGVSLTVRRGEKVGIIGPNGLGKSTLLKIITGNTPADAGRVALGHETKIGYFAQDHHEILKRADMLPLDFVWDACPSEATSYVRGQLGRVLFSGEDVKKPIGKLSGGEAARLVFARLAVEKPNVLVLDEPTNHLDLEAIGALLEGLTTFTGTVLFVSHDRHFVSRLATRIIELTPNGPNDFPGTFDEYLERCGDDHLDAGAVIAKAKAEAKPKEAPKATSADEGSWEEQKKRRNRLAALPQRRDKVLAKIEEHEARKKEIAALYAKEGFFEKASAAEIAALEAEDTAIATNVETLMAEWEALEAEIGAG